MYNKYKEYVKCINEALLLMCIICRTCIFHFLGESIFCKKYVKSINKAMLLEVIRCLSYAELGPAISFERIHYLINIFNI